MMMSKYFDESETECHCGCGFNEVNSILLMKLDELRERVGKPIQLSNVCRCENHNAEVGGVRDSQHVQGNAADVIVPDGYTVDSLAELAAEVGFDGIGRYYEDDFVHVDVRDDGESPNYYQWSDQDD